MSDAEWLEVRETTEAMVTNLGKLAEQNPESSVNGQEFDALLSRAQATFPDSAAIRQVTKINGVTTLADLFGKLSVVQGAVKAAFVSRNLESARRHNEENRRRWQR
jgi:hypothetical protein